MKQYITFEKEELNSKLSNIAYNLHLVASSIFYFQQYAKIQDVEHDGVVEESIKNIEKILDNIKNDFNQDDSSLYTITSYLQKTEIEKANHDWGHLKAKK